MGHGFFIWGSYIVTAAVLIGLVAYIVHDWRRQKRLLALLEAQNVPRRPSKGRSKAAKKGK